MEGRPGFHVAMGAVCEKCSLVPAPGELVLRKVLLADESTHSSTSSALHYLHHNPSASPRWLTHACLPIIDTRQHMPTKRHTPVDLPIAHTQCQHSHGTRRRTTSNTAFRRHAK
eukprot:2639047-Prymnesium_polylepis.1